MKSVKFSAGVKFGMLTVIEYAGSVPNGNYEKANCRWADRITQAANKRNSLSIHKE